MSNIGLLSNLQEQCWPNFFIVGAAKAGTSSLYAYLNDIPGIFMSRIKEPNYFSINILPINDPLNPIRDKKKYLELFKNVKDEKIVGEASPYYLSDPDAPKLIHEVSPNAKILISLRNPIERMFSHYLMENKYHNLPSFHEQLKIEIKLGEQSKEYFALKHGLYSENVKRYLETFGTKQVKIIIFEEWVKNPKKIIKEILQFLEIDHPLDNIRPEVKNKFLGTRGKFSGYLLGNKTLSRIVKNILPSSARVSLRDNILRTDSKPKIEKKDVGALLKYYREDVLKLNFLLSRKLPWSDFLHN